MNLNEYHDLAQRTAKQFPTQIENLNHAALGLATEFFEIVVANNPGHVAEEIGDFCWYIPVACQALNFRFGEVTAAFIQNAKLPIYQQQGAQATGDFITMVKRLVIYKKDLTTEMTNQAMRDLLKMMHFAANECTHYGLDFNTVLENNIAKLKKRFPDAYSDHAAEARADKGGKDARNS